MTKHTFYITTPIYYVTAQPHLGSLYSTLLADVATRWHKLLGYTTFFLTGTDEHGQKIAQAAVQAGKSPQEFVDEFAATYRTVWQKYNLEYSYFIRTTDSQHVRAVQKWLIQLQEQGDIYKSQYQGWYCTPCETFVLEEEHEPVCPSCQRPTHYVSEESYFFRLSAYQDRLLQWYKEHPDIITPAERLAEVVSFVERGLKDLSISRTTVTWGIPFPNDPRHVTYVWADALANYITAIGYLDPDKAHEFNYWWPADVQVLGKDIVRFHAVYWLAFLMASGLALPKKLLVHGWIKIGQQKMSKSLGNVIDPVDLYNRYGADPVRYYLTRYMAITQDSPFSIEDLEKRITSDLADDLGNLVQRMVMLAEKYSVHTISAPNSWQESELSVYRESIVMLKHMRMYMAEYSFHMAYATVWKFIKYVNSYFHTQEPWKQARTNKEHFSEILSATAHSLYTIALVLWPVMPQKTSELLVQLGVSFTAPEPSNILDTLLTTPWQQTFILTVQPPLFTKYQQPVVSSASEVSMNHSITLDEFKKVILMIGTIETCASVPNADKLYVLTVNFGEVGIRQILSGIKQYYIPSELIGVQAVFVINLLPRSLMGFESHGMILTAANQENKPIIVTVRDSVPNGTVLK